MKLAAAALRWILLAVTVILACLPTLAAISGLLQPADRLPKRQSWIPTTFDASGAIRVLESASLWAWLRNSLIIAVGVMLLSLALAIPAAFAFARRDFTGRRSLLIGVIATQTVAPAVLIIPIFSALARLGLLDSYLGVIVVGTAFILPFSIWLLAGFMASFSREIEEASYLDGASIAHFVRTILLPNIVPGLAATAVWSFMYGWNEYIFALTFLVSDQDKWPLAVGAASSVGMFSIDWQLLMAVSVVGTAPVLMLFILLRRPLEAGLEKTAH